jgi:hypothetical protein
VGLTAEQTRQADALARALTIRYVAVPDSFTLQGGTLRISFVHSPFDPWTEPDCSTTYTPSQELALPILATVWSMFGERAGVQRVVFVTRAGESHTIRRGLTIASCHAGATTYEFSADEARAATTTGVASRVAASP